MLACLLVVALTATALVAETATATPAQAAPLRNTKIITWNMQGSNAGLRWQENVLNYASQVDVVLLQEAGAGPPNSVEQVNDVTTPEGHTYQNAMWNPGSRNGPYDVSFMQTDTNGGNGAGGRVNIAIVTRQTPNEVRVVQNPLNAGRNALGVRFDNDWYFTFHGLSGGGGDSVGMLNAINDEVTRWGTQTGRNYNWTVGGDFNADPAALRARNNFPSYTQTFSSGRATQQSGGELDYLVSSHRIDNHPVHRLNGAGSDHYPVQVGGMQAAAEPVEMKVMPMGDSITAGVNHSTGDGYIFAFFLAMLAAPFLSKRSLDLVGSQRSGERADRDHEGHPGWRIDQIAGVAACSVEAFRPNVILLHAGTNDMNQDHQLDGAPDRLRGLINEALSDAPEATVLVATLIPSTKAGMQAKIDRYNAALPGMVQQLRNEGKRVRLVNMASALTTEDVDGSHPHDAGYDKMADVWVDAMYAAADEGLLQKPVEGSGQACTGEEDGDQVSAAGPGWRALGVIAPGMSSPAGRTDLVELNGDNRADYVRIADDGSVRAALNTVGEPGKPEWQDQGNIIFGIADPGDGDKVRFADMNGDGLDDYLLLQDDGSFRLWWQQEKGWVHVPNIQAPDTTGVTSAAVRFADVNGDGRDDYLRVGEDGSVHAYLNAVGSGTTVVDWVERLNWAPGVRYGSRDKLRLADVNGDRKADYLMVGNQGAVHAYINNGGGGNGGFTEHLYFVNEIGYSGDKLTFRDISGDGKADYVNVYDGGSIRSWLNRGGNIG